MRCQESFSSKLENTTITFIKHQSLVKFTIEHTAMEKAFIASLARKSTGVYLECGVPLECFLVCFE